MGPFCGFVIGFFFAISLYFGYATHDPKPTGIVQKWAEKSGPQKMVLKTIFLFFCVHVSPNWSKVPDLDSSRRADHFSLVFSSWGVLGLEIQTKIVSNRFLHFFCNVWPCYISKTSDSESSHRTDHLALLISSWGLLRTETRAQMHQVVFDWLRPLKCLNYAENARFGLLASC